MKEVFDELCACMKGEYSVFSFLEAENLKGFCKYFQCKTAQAGEVLWEEGDPCDYVAFVVSGRVEVKKQTEFKGKHVVVGMFSRGAVVGALCILDNSPRAVTAVAREDVTLATIKREDFERLISENPELGARLMKGMLLSLSVRLRKSFERLATFF